MVPEGRVSGARSPTNSRGSGQPQEKYKFQVTGQRNGLRPDFGNSGVLGISERMVIELRAESITYKTRTPGYLTDS
jgi:hypothetical protein